MMFPPYRGERKPLEGENRASGNGGEGDLNNGILISVI